MRSDRDAVIRSLQSDGDIAKYSAFHAAHTRPVWGATAERLIRYHPHSSPDDYFIMEDTATGRIISTTCLIPWRCQYDGIPVDVAMLEFVLTHPDHRRRGCMRSMIERFHQRVNESQFDLCIINGIPYYYRQYGYSYAVDSRTGEQLSTRMIPEPVPGASEAPEPAARITLRRAKLENVPELVRLHRKSAKTIDFHDGRDEKYWEFLIQRLKCPAYLIQTARDRIAGYVCFQEPDPAGVVRVFENAVFDRKTGMEVLRQLKKRFTGEIWIQGSETDILVRCARSLGSTGLPKYQWLWRIPDLPRFLLKLKPAVDRRLANSEFRGFTGEITINLFREAIRLSISQGSLENVDVLGFVDASRSVSGSAGGDLQIPGEAFIRWALGYRSLDELSDAWPDITVSPGKRPLLDVLFPKMHSYFSMPWKYYGPHP